MPDLHSAIKKFEPDLLLIDTNTWGAQAAAQAWGGPWASFCPFQLPLRSKDAPPFGLGLPPARGSIGRLRDRLLEPILIPAIARTMLPAYNSVRRDLGLADLKNTDELYLTPPLLLSLTAEPFEYHRSDWPNNVVLVGHCEWEPPADEPSWLSKINRPIILITTSTEYQADERLVRIASEAFANENVFLIATVPSGDISTFDILANARIEKFLPHGAILDRAAVAITHGGMGATQKALARGVPVCAVPFGRDQFEVARRVENSGAGTRISAKRLTPERLRNKVFEAIGHSAGAKKVAGGFAAAGGPIAASHAIEKRLLNKS